MSEKNSNLTKSNLVVGTKQTMGSSSSGSSRNDAKESDSNPSQSTNLRSTPARKSIQEVAMISSGSNNISESSSGTEQQQQPSNETTSFHSARPETSPQTSSNNSNATTTNLGLDQSAQLRSTLAIGQLIASNRPTAGSRLIANELKQLSKTIREESVSIRKEVANLSNNLATTLKRVLDDDREQRNLSATGGLARRPMFGSFAARRFPVFRRPRRPPLQAVQRYGTTDATISPNQNSPLQTSSAGTNSSSSIGNVASKTTTTTGTQTPEIIIGPTSQKQAAPTAMKLSNLATTATKSPTAAMSAAKALAMVFKGPWLTLDRSYDGEVDTDSNETTPSSSP